MAEPVLSLEARISGNSISFRILSMDERLRIADKVHTTIFKSPSTGLSIKGYTHPEINENSIYLRGSDISRDESYFVSYPFRNFTEEFLYNVVVTVQEYLEDVFDECIFLHRDAKGSILKFYNGGIPQGYSLE